MGTNMSTNINLNILRKTLATAAILLAATFSFSAPVPVHAGKVKLFLSPGNLDSFISNIGIRRTEGGDTDGAFNYGFTVEVGEHGQRSGRHVAFDYYAFGNIRTPGADVTRLSGSALWLGSRTHYDNGFYIGPGILTAELDLEQAATGGGTEVLDSYPAVTFALSLGYDYTFDNGLVLGLHVIRSVPVTTVVFKNPNLTSNRQTEKDFYLQFIGFGIGYDW